MVRLILLLSGILILCCIQLLQQYRSNAPLDMVTMVVEDADGTAASLIQVHPNFPEKRIALATLPPGVCMLRGNYPQLTIAYRDEDMSGCVAFNASYQLFQWDNGELIQPPLLLAQTPFATVDHSGSLYISAGDLYSISDGRRVPQPDNIFLQHVSISPDHARIALIGGDETATLAAVYGDDTLTPLLRDRAFDPIAPIWSPDGSRVALFIANELFSFDIAERTLNFVGIMTSFPAGRGLWSPDGDWLAVEMIDSGSRLWVINLSNGTSTKVTQAQDPLRSFVWWDDDLLVHSDDDGHIYMTNPATAVKQHIGAGRFPIITQLHPQSPQYSDLRITGLLLAGTGVLLMAICGLRRA